jgi:hypothetical protein
MGCELTDVKFYPWIDASHIAALFSPFNPAALIWLKSPSASA